MSMNVKSYETATERCRVVETCVPRRGRDEMIEGGFTYVDGPRPYWSKFFYNTETCTVEERVQGNRSISIVTTFA